MSTMESTAPTSWKWTCSGATPWIFPSARARFSKMATDLPATGFGRSDCSNMARMSPKVRCSCHRSARAGSGGA